MNETTSGDNTQAAQNGHISTRVPNGGINIAGGDNYNTTNGDTKIAGGNNYSSPNDDSNSNNQLCGRNVNIVAADNNDIRIDNDASDSVRINSENQNPISNDANGDSQYVTNADNALHNGQDDLNNVARKNIPNGNINILVGSGNTIAVKNSIIKISNRSNHADDNNTFDDDNTNDDDDLGSISDEEEYTDNNADASRAPNDERHVGSINGDHRIHRFPDLFNSS